MRALRTVVSLNRIDMHNNLTKKLLLQSIFVVSTLVLMLTGCRVNEEVSSLSLVTETHDCVLKNYTHLTGQVYPLSISVDQPIEGPQLLLDSLTAFFNKTLYDYFDDGEKCHLPYDSVFSTDVKSLPEHYRDAYKRFFLPDSTEVHEFRTDCLELNMVAQTDIYVTYEVNSVFFGEGAEVATEWVTFVKSDGHRLTDVISEKNLLKFYQENPQYRNEVVWEYIQKQEADNQEAGMGCNVGLLTDSVAHQFTFAPGIFEDMKYPLKSIAPYLSKEAQKLIKP